MAWAVTATYNREERSVEQNLKETTRALALAVSGELSGPEAVARTLAGSGALASGDLESFYGEAQRATRPTGGWAVLLDEGQMLLNTSRPYGSPLKARQPRGDREIATGAETTEISPLFEGPLSGQKVIAVTVPAPRAGGEVLALSVVVPPAVIQRVLDEQKLPAGWISAVMDQRAMVVARRPDPARWLGVAATPDMQEQTRQRKEGFFRSTSLDGVPTTAFFSAVPGTRWTLAIAVPNSLLGANVRRSVTEAVIAALIMLGLSLLAAVAAARRIAAPAHRLREAARALEADGAVTYEPAHVNELDAAGQALVHAASRIRDAHQEMERRVEAAVRQTQEAQQRVEAGQRLEALSQLTGGVAHDVNNLLAVVHNSAALLALRPDDPSRASRIAAIQRSVAAGKELTQKLLSFARQRTQKPDTVDLREWLPAVLPVLASADGPPAEIVLDIEPDVAPLHVDAAELQIALLNLTVNARHAAPDGAGHILIGAANLPASEATPPRVAIRVQDNGKGIALALQHRVFEPFFSTRRHAGGTGLGLSQVYGFCTQSGGTVTLESAPGKGACFTMELPAAADLPAQAGATLPAQDRGAEAATADGPASVRLLYVEDNVDVGELTHLLLEDLGYRVDWVLGGDDALAVFDSERFDIVLSDFVMPGTIDGLQLGRHLRATAPHVPFVLLSGYAAEAGEAARAGFTVLQKPCSVEELARTLRKALAEHAGRRAAPDSRFART